jgi:hypothetical protein
LFKDILNQVITRTLGVPCPIAPATPRCHRYRPLRSRLERLYHRVLGKTPAVVQLPSTPVRRITRLPYCLPTQQPDQEFNKRRAASAYRPPGLARLECCQRHRVRALGVPRCGCVTRATYRGP